MNFVCKNKSENDLQLYIDIGIHFVKTERNIMSHYMQICLNSCIKDRSCYLVERYYWIWTCRCRMTQCALQFANCKQRIVLNIAHYLHKTHITALRNWRDLIFWRTKKKKLQRKNSYNKLAHTKLNHPNPTSHSTLCIMYIILLLTMQVSTKQQKH